MDKDEICRKTEGSWDYFSCTDVFNKGAAYLIKKSITLFPSFLLPLRYFCSCGASRSRWWCIFKLGCGWWWRSSWWINRVWISCTSSLTRWSLFSGCSASSTWSTFWWWHYGNRTFLPLQCNCPSSYILLFCVVVCDTPLWLIQLSWRWPWRWLNSWKKCN